MNRWHTQSGAMMMIPVLISGALILLIGLSVTLRSIGEIDMGFAEGQALKVLAVADGCAQEALLKLSQDTSYTGATLAIGRGECSVLVTSAATLRTIAVDASLDKWSRSLTIQVDTSSSPIEIISWEHTP